MTATNDAGLIAVCSAARAATLAYRAAAERDEPAETMSILLERELSLLACVTTTRAKTTAGLAAKAAALDHFMQANSGSEPAPEAVALCVALIEDGIGVLKGMIGLGAASERTHDEPWQ